MIIDWPLVVILTPVILGIIGGGGTVLKFILDKKNDNRFMNNINNNIVSELQKKILDIETETKKEISIVLNKEISELKEILNKEINDRKDISDKIEKKIEKLQEERAQLYEKILEWMYTK
jgi:hypothetical protein